MDDGERTAERVNDRHNRSGQGGSRCTGGHVDVTRKDAHVFTEKVAANIIHNYARQVL